MFKKIFKYSKINNGRMVFAPALFLLFLLLFLDAGAVEKVAKEGASVVKAKTEIALEDIAWLAGRWQGEAFGGICEEAWEKPSGPSMVGTFKLIAEDKIKFYEIMTITPDSSGLTLKLKHFNADLTGWEEKDKVVEFPFVEISENMVQFDGLSYQLVSGDSLKITVDMKQADGSVSQVVIDCLKIDR